MTPRAALLLSSFAVAACSVGGVTVSLSGASAGAGTGSAGSTGSGGLGVEPDPNTVCPAGKRTSVSGTVYDPRGEVELYNAVVYVANGSAPLPPFKDRIQCETCTEPVPAKAALTGPDGKFVLEDVPAGTVDLVVQLGKWRRKQTLFLKACEDNALTDPELTRLPRTSREGDIPRIALSTGHSDALECLLRKIGIDDTEFTTDTEDEPGRVNLFVGCAGDQANQHTGASRFAPHLRGKAFPSTNQLFDGGNLHSYDVLIFSCEGHKCDTAAANRGEPPIQTPAHVAQLVEFANQGGRVFLDHTHYNWLNHADAPIENAAVFSSSADDIPSPLSARINTSFPKGQAFAEWLVNVGASSRLGEFDVSAARISAQKLSPNRAQSWIERELDPRGYFYFTIGTPVAVQNDDPAPQACGRVVFTDLHVSKDGGGASSDFSDQDTPFPDGCTTRTLSAQEKALEFMLFDLTSCVQPESAIPTAPQPK